MRQFIASKLFIPTTLTMFYKPDLKTMRILTTVDDLFNFSDFDFREILTSEYKSNEPYASHLQMKDKKMRKKEKEPNVMVGEKQLSL